MSQREVLEALRKGKKSVRELCKETGMPKDTVFRNLSRLVEWGEATREWDGGNTFTE